MSNADLERIKAETGDHGDKRTVDPRLVCPDCGSFVYVTLPRGFDGGPVRAECDCSHGNPARGILPDNWVRINRFVHTETDDEVDRGDGVETDGGESASGMDRTAVAWWIERDGEHQWLCYDTESGETVSVDVTDAGFGGSVKR